MLFNPENPPTINSPMTTIRSDYGAIEERAAPSNNAGFGYFQAIVEDRLRQEQMTEWTTRAIDDTYVRIDAPYATCAFDQDWTAGFRQVRPNGQYRHRCVQCGSHYR